MKCPTCHHDNIEGADECSFCGAALYGLRIDTYEGPDFIRRPLSDMRKRPIYFEGVDDPVALAVRTMQREAVNCVFVHDAICYMTSEDEVPDRRPRRRDLL